jgi:hypothetical protein
MSFAWLMTSRLWFIALVSSSPDRPIQRTCRSAATGVEVQLQPDRRGRWTPDGVFERVRALSDDGDRLGGGGEVVVSLCERSRLPRRQNGDGLAQLLRANPAHADEAAGECSTAFRSLITDNRSPDGSGAFRIAGEGTAARGPGGFGSANADMSNDKHCERQCRRKSKGSCVKLIFAGLAGP